MKYIKYIFNLKLIALSSLLISFQACKDDIDSPSDGPTYTITGRLLQDCNMQAVANQKIDLFQEYATGLDGNLHGGVLGDVIRWAHGNPNHFQGESGSLTIAGTTGRVVPNWEAGQGLAKARGV